MPEMKLVHLDDGAVEVTLIDPTEYKSLSDFNDTIPSHLMEIPKLVEITLKGDAIASIAIGDGTFKLVIFHPSAATMKSVQMYEGQDIDLTIEDQNGLFSPRVPQRITGHVYEPGNKTMIVDTERQS